MKEPLLFREVQGVATKNLTQFLKVLAIIFAICLGINFIKNRGDFDQYSRFLAVGFAGSCVGAFFTSYQLITEINEEGISVRFPPFQPAEKFFPWSHISEVYIRQYNPLLEYNGWGNKRGVSGWCFTFNGNVGLQLVLSSGEQILIGTAQPKVLADVLEKMNRIND